MFSPFVETLKTPFNRKWRRHFRELGKCICVDAALHTKRFIAQRKTDSFPAKRSEKRETPFPDNLLGRKTEFPKFRHYRQFYRTSCEERIKWSQNSIKRLDYKKKIGLFWKEHGNMSPLDPCYYMAQPITGEIGDGGRGKCVLGKHVIRSSDPSICFQLCSKNKKR